MTTNKPQQQSLFVPFSELQALLGKAENDVAVTTYLAKCGKVVWSKPSDGSRYVQAKEAGFELLFGIDDSSDSYREPRYLRTVILHLDANVRPNGTFQDLPYKLGFMRRKELLTLMPRPDDSWVEGQGAVAPETTAKPVHDRWFLDGLEFKVNYTRGVADMVHVELDKRALGNKLDPNPLYRSVMPADAMPEAPRIAPSLLLTWALLRNGLFGRAQASPLAPAFVKREITPLIFFDQACRGILDTLDIDPTLHKFLLRYVQGGVFQARRGVDAQTKARIAKLLNLDPSRDMFGFSEDYKATFTGAVPNLYYIADSWTSFDRLAPVLDARWADYQSTQLKSVPDLALYEQAASLRDKVILTESRLHLAKPPADPTLSVDLLNILGLALANPKVKAVLARADLPIGKRIDEQANPALGVSYMGSRITIDGKQTLAVTEITFYAQGRQSYIRGIGTDVQFEGYPHDLPNGVRLGDAKGTVIEKLGKPLHTSEKNLSWELDNGRGIYFHFESDALIQTQWYFKERDQGTS